MLLSRERSSKMNKLSYSKIENGIYVRNLYYLNNGRLSKKDNKYIINSYKLFVLTLDLGKRLLDDIVDDDEIIDLFREYGLPITDDFLDYKLDIWVDRIRELSKNVYLFFSISIMCNKIIESKDLYLEKFETLHKYLENINWITTFSNSFEYNRFSLDDVVKALNTNKVKYDDKDDICNYIRHALINYIENEYSKSPITLSIVRDLNENNLNIDCGFFRTCDNVFGLIYFELLNHIVPNRLNVTYKSCYYCGSIFKRNGNTKYCKTCRDNGIPEWIKNQKYEESEKGKQTRANYQRKKQN